jgi:hypothetical protein
VSILIPKLLGTILALSIVSSVDSQPPLSRLQAREADDRFSKEDDSLKQPYESSGKTKTVYEA